MLMQDELYLFVVVQGCPNFYTPNNHRCHKVHLDPNHHIAYFENRLYNVVALKYKTKNILIIK